MAEQELYEIVTDAATYRYTSSSADIVRSGETYTAVAIRRDRLVETDDLNRAALSIYAAYTLPYAVAARVRPLPAIVTVFAYDNDLWSITWSGRVVAVNHHGLEVEILAEGLTTESGRLGLYAKYQIACRHALYDGGCKVVPASFSHTGEITAITGLQLTVVGADGAADGFYTGGYAVFENGDYRTITDHTGTAVTVYFTSVDLATGQDVTIYAGCDHTMATCKSVFNNLLNYGGFPWMPTPGGNPFESSYPHLPIRRRR